MSAVFHSNVPSRRRGQEGVALVVVLLFTVVILMIIISTTATMSLGARTGGVNERAAYQALLAAESALNTFPVRMSARLKTQPLPKRTGNPQSDHAAMNAWLGGLNSYAAGGRQASLAFERLTLTATGATFQLAATGNEGNTRKIALQDFELRQVGPGVLRSPRAALTSLPRINATGSADITGQANDGVITRVAGLATRVSLADRQFTLPVQDATGLLVGDYVTVGNTTLRLDRIQGNSLTVTQVLPAGTAVAANVLTGDVNLMLNAVAQTYATFTDPMTLKASNATDFVPGETITVNGRSAAVTGLNADTGEITVDWTGSLPTSLPEGTQILRDVRAMRSAQSITPKANKLDAYTMDSLADCTGSGHGNNQTVTCAGANDPVLRGDPADPYDHFFSDMILGMTDEQIDAIPLTNASAGPMQNEIRRIRAADFDDVIKNGNSSGILIVDGDINSNVNGNTVFNGLIYFRGNQGGKFNGNLTVNGAIAVRGGPIEGLTTDDVATDLTGSLDLNFNAVALRKQLAAVQGYSSLGAVKGTWRQR